MTKHQISSPAWWKEAAVYQIYPSSFQDSNGDGVGDLNGITQRLDYIKSLGVDCIWLCPIYKSPQHDMGYDISDYRDINPDYGTLADWENLVKEVHARGLKLVMDLVVNHTSDEHVWFEESRQSRDNPKADWYIWRKGASEGKPPNNWKSFFQGSAWKYEPKRDEWFLRLFCPEQPDLNWENPDVREAVYDTMKFWLDKGVDGFRMDVINLISKVLPELEKDAPITDPDQIWQDASQFYANGPRVHEFLHEMNTKVIQKYPDMFSVGETPCSHDPAVLIPYSLPKNKELQMVFQFELHDIDGSNDPMVPKSFAIPEFKAVITKWQTAIIKAGGWNSLYLENHDQARSIPRFASKDPQYRTIAGKLLAAMHTTLCGTVFVYQGEELGMVNVPDTFTLEDFKGELVNYYNQALAARRKKTGEQNPDMFDILQAMRLKARDNARTPVQWDSTKHAGFTNGEPWMRVHDDYETWNIESARNDPDSVLCFWQKALQLRKDEKILIYGDFEDLEPSHPKLFVYRRTLGDEVALVLLNFTPETVSYAIPKDKIAKDAKVVLGNYDESASSLQGDKVELQPFEARVYVA